MENQELFLSPDSRERALNSSTAYTAMSLEVLVSIASKSVCHPEIPAESSI